jgi:hypothetical protein
MQNRHCSRWRAAGTTTKGTGLGVGGLAEPVFDSRVIQSSF